MRKHIIQLTAIAFHVAVMTLVTACKEKVDSPDPPELNISPAYSSIVFSLNGKTVTFEGNQIEPAFTVTTNQETWDAVREPDQTWLTVTKLIPGFILSAEANTDTEPRTAKVTVTAGKADVITIDVTQKGTGWSDKDWEKVTSRLVINVDCWHFFQARTDAQLNNVANVESLIDGYARGKVTHVFLNTNAQRAAFRSATREAFWDPVPGVYSEEDMLNFNEPRRAKILYDNGIDPYEVWIRRCREKGISPWLSMRMNDVHYGDDRTHHWHSEFSRSNPQYWRVPNATTATDWNSYALDYAHQAVREHQLAFFEELLERYDPDGIELDWIRNPYHLRQGRYETDAHFLDEFVRDAHNLAKEWADRRGHNIELAVRVPTSPVASEAVGLNADRWVRDGLADMIIISPYFATTDWDPPVDQWRERVGKAKEHVPILPCAEWQTQAYVGATSITSRELPMIYAFVDNARFRGADGIYMFNWFSVTGVVADKLFGEGFDAKTVMSSQRRYLVTYRDIAPVAGTNNAQLPKMTNVAQTIRIPMGSVPQNGEVYLILGFEKRDGLATATFSASMNGKKLGQHEEEKYLHLLGSSPQRAVKFRVPLESLQAGENLMVLQPTSGVFHRVVWVELQTKP